MTVEDQKSSIVIGEKRGMPIYKENPSVPQQGTISKVKRKQIGDEQKGVVLDTATGELLGQGTACFYEFEEVDKERFVKLFLAGFKQAADLSKAGLMVFTVVYSQVQENPNTDRIELNYYIAQTHSPEMSERSYQRGVRELLEKQFIFRSFSDNLFFVNIQFMFNGDRLAFVKGYYRKGSKAPKVDVNQLSLPFENPGETEED